MTKSKRKKTTNGDNKKWLFGILIAVGVLGVSLALAFVINDVVPIEETSRESGSALIIPIKGTLMTESGSSLFSQQRGSMEIVQEIREADSNPNVDGIIFEVNSPGGAPVASHDIAEAIQNTEKPTVSVIREVGASGSYWAASSADHVISDEMSLTGSVGVLTNVITAEGLLDEYNITYERIVGGEYKDIGTPLRDVEPDERNELQRKIDLMHDFFLDDVTENRNLTDEQREEVGTGIFFVGLEAKDVGLVDEFGSIREGEEYLSNTTDMEIDSYRRERTRGFFSNMGSFFQQMTSPLMEEAVLEGRSRPRLR